MARAQGRKSSRRLLQATVRAQPCSPAEGVHPGLTRSCLGVGQGPWSWARRCCGRRRCTRGQLEPATLPRKRRWGSGATSFASGRGRAGGMTSDCLVSQFILFALRHSLLGLLHHLAHELLPVHQLRDAQLFQPLVAAGSRVSLWRDQAALQPLTGEGMRTSGRPRPGRPP